MQDVRDWINAPWPHVKGVLKRSMVEFMNSTEQDVDKLESVMDRKITAVVDKHIKWKRTGSIKPSPWWNQACDVALKWKQECFSCRYEKVEEYNKAVKFARKVPKAAFKKYQVKLKDRLAGMRKTQSRNLSNEFFSLLISPHGVRLERCGLLYRVRTC